MAEKPKKPQKLKARLPRGLEDRGPAAIAATRRMVEKIREVFERYGTAPRVFDPKRLYFLPDHSVPAFTIQIAEGVKLMKEFEVDPKRDVSQDIWGHDAGIEVLGAIGPEAKAAVPSLIAALDSKQTGERLAAADA